MNIRRASRMSTYYSEKVIYYVSIFVVSVLLSYAYLALSTAFLTAEMDKNSDMLGSVKESLSTIESTYLQISSKINLDLAYSMGFHDNLEEAVFISNQSKAALLLENRNDQ